VQEGQREGALQEVRSSLAVISMAAMKQPHLVAERLDLLLEVCILHCTMLMLTFLLEETKVLINSAVSAFTACTVKFVHDRHLIWRMSIHLTGCLTHQVYICMHVIHSLPSDSGPRQKPLQPSYFACRWASAALTGTL